MRIDVEERFPIAVEVICVSDMDLDEASTALVQAAGEAVTNAAKHSGASRVDVFAEVEPIDLCQCEAAVVLGAGLGRVLLSVDGPQLLRAGGLATGFALATSLGEFGATSFLARPQEPTLPVVVYRLIGSPGSQNQGLSAKGGKA